MACFSGQSNEVVKELLLNKVFTPNFLIFSKPKSAQLNWVRTMVRRAERRLVALSKKEDLNPKLLSYINRLSDYLFMLARVSENE